MKSASEPIPQVVRPGKHGRMIGQEVEGSGRGGCRMEGKNSGRFSCREETVAVDCFRMPKISRVSATKTDIAMLMSEIGKLYDANHRWKDEITRQIGDSEQRTKRHFDLAVEHIRAELLGARKDAIENQADRIVRLEQHVGLATG